ncbi:hypothetical protein ACEWY4_010271 [Coilia grayii]|uniref:Bardet-Biedl syndrome 10 n=1 Tax=Coilia grayii TaxID=363190 RepID=A0ABD1K1E8_9TELE
MADGGHVRSTLAVVSALESVVLRSFGPSGGLVLFTRDSGEVLLTRHGQKILRSLHVEHPICRMVLDCIQAHCTMAADGSKSFLILLASLLRRIHAQSKTCRDISNTRARQLANQLLHLCHNGLDDVILRQVTPCVSSLYMSGYHGDILEGLVGGYVAGRVAICQVEVLTRVICQFFWKWHMGQAMAKTVRYIHRNFPFLHSTVSGLPIGQSCVQEGLLLGCDWTVFFENCSKEPIRVLILINNEFAIDDAVSVFDNCIYDSHAIGRRLCMCVEELDVFVLLSPVKCPDILLQWAIQKQVCVAECVEPPLLDLLSQLSQSQAATVGRVTMVTSVSYAVLGGHRLACVGLIPSYPYGNSEHLLHPHTLLLCAPGPGPLDQCASVCEGVFTMLYSVFEAEHTVTALNQSLNSHTDQSEEMSHNPASYSPMKSKNTVPVSAPAPDQWHWLLCAGRVVPVGGVFEVLLHHFLLSSDWLAEPQVRSILTESVLDLPRMLHFHKPRLFVQFQASLLNKLRFGPSHQPCSGALESVSCKQQLLVSVLQCVCKLLSVDHILHTHTPVNTLLHTTKTTHSDKEDED